jgi:hypothetical protein
VIAGICKRPDEYPYSNYKKVELANNELGNFIDIVEDKDIVCEKIINNFLKEKNIELINLRDDREKLRKIVMVLRDEYNFSYKKISRKLKMDKTLIYRTYNKYRN